MECGGPGPTLGATTCEQLHAMVPCCHTKFYPTLLDLKPVGGGCHILSFLGTSACVIQD